jgi:hypothetical protein
MTDKRTAPRKEISYEGLIVSLDGAVVEQCKLVNVSASGAKLKFAPSAPVPDLFVLLLSRNGKVRRQCQVAWRQPDSVGVRFVASESAASEAMSCISETLARLAAKNTELAES